MLDFVRERGAVHPREVDAHFAHGTVTNYWGGSSNATTHLLDAMHYRGLLRVARREGGIRIYAAHEHDAAGRRRVAERARGSTRWSMSSSRKYAPLPAASLSCAGRAGCATPCRSGAASCGRAARARKQRLAHARVDGVDWYWPADERRAPTRRRRRRVRLLAPFDPVVWDRRRFELLWGWAYRFEAYTPAAKRKLGYYALPLLWRDEVIGWANVSARDGDIKWTPAMSSGRAPRVAPVPRRARRGAGTAACVPARGPRTSRRPGTILIAVRPSPLHVVMQLNDAVRKLLYTEQRSATWRCLGARRGMPSPMKIGTTVMMNSSIASSSRKDPMISPPPIIQTFLPACVRRRSAKAPIDSVTKWTPAGTEAGGGRRENT